MKRLISPAEVAEYAFGGTAAVRRPQTDGAIAAAERRFLEPALGGLCDAMREGLYPDLLAEHVRPALARYVKCLLLPQLALQAGAGGVGRPTGDRFAAPTEPELRRLTAAVRAEADALLLDALEIVRADPASYPEWNGDRQYASEAVMRGGVLFMGRRRACG